MPFLHIEKCWEIDSKRDLENLKSVYHDKDTLQKHIRSVIGDKLPASEIAEKKVLLKPNWVREELRDEEEYCLRTNDNLLLAVLDEILSRTPKEVIVGDAPIQGCHWEKMVENISPQIQALAEKYKIPVKTIDFRRVVFAPQTNDFHDRTQTMRPGILFDIGKESYLEDICNDKRKPFRITQYPYDFLAKHHHAGVHRYCITPEFFDCDLIITLPKIKTHEKAGLTNALKILVGINADKNYLPHHRVGGTGHGGDCYPGNNLLRRITEWLLDSANRKRGTRWHNLLATIGRYTWSLSRPKAEHRISAGWYGNDTTWRMVMDLNLIAQYGQRDGTINRKSPRKIYSLCDGIIAGQGNGPLSPEPAALGMLIFTDNNTWADISAGILMGMDIEKIPLLRTAKAAAETLDSIVMQQKTSSLMELQKYSICVKMPDGWKNYNKN